MTNPPVCCPFRNTAFKRLGNHLPHCPERRGRDYSSLLSINTLQKRNKASCKGPCPVCGKVFARFDTHLRVSASCKFPRPSDEPTTLTDPADFHSSQSVEPQSSAMLVSANHNTTLPLNLVTPKPLLPFNTPRDPEEWAEVDADLAHGLVPDVISGNTPDEKNSIPYQGICDYDNQIWNQKKTAIPKIGGSGAMKGVSKG